MLHTPALDRLAVIVEGQHDEAFHNDLATVGAESAPSTPKPRKHRRTRPEVPKDVNGHKWMYACNLAAGDERQMNNAVLKGYADIPTPDDRMRVDVLDVMCPQCRRTYDDAKDQRCVDPRAREHLIGGPRLPRPE